MEKTFFVLMLMTLPLTFALESQLCGNIQQESTEDLKAACNKRVEDIVSLKEREISNLKMELEWSLLEVSRLGNADKLKRLLNAGVNIETRDVNGSTPLLIATANNHANVVKILLDAGANPNEKNRWQDTTLVWAAHFDNVEMAKLLVAKGAMLEYINGQTALHYAAKRGDVNIVKYFLTLGADINKKDDDGMTPLAHAAKANKTALVEYLESQGATM